MGLFAQVLKTRFFLDPLRVSRSLRYVPHFVRVFVRLMRDPRVPLRAKLVPVMAVLVLMFPPFVELDLIPVVGELDLLLVGYITFRLFLWLCPPEVVREHVTKVAHHA